MMIIKNKTIKYFLILVISFLAASFTWPLKTPKITSTFGESRGDHFHDGIDIISNDGQIYSPQEGKLLYYWDQSIYPMDNEPGSGNYVILKHNDDKATIYMHMEKGIKAADSFAEGDILGRVGNTGHSYGAHLHFSIFSKQGICSHNPLGLFSYYEDVKAPEINGFFMRINDRYILIKDKAEIRLTNHYPLLISIVDSATTNERLGIAKLSAWVNGIKMSDHVFNEIMLKDNKSYIGDHAFEDVFDEIGYYKLANIKYKDGLNEFRIIAEDYVGNKTEKLFSFKANLDMK
jgi:murein DD-endopeptidase MepM/ murein hydrolase activator NlpD